LSFDRQPGEDTGRLSWSAPEGFQPHGYQVFEGGEMVGETPDRSIAIDVKPGHTYRFAVRSLDPTAQATSCVNRLRQTVEFQPPARAAGLAATAVRKRSARLVWSPSAQGDARVSGYRVYRDGRPYKLVRGLSLRVATSAKPHKYRVAGKDARGNIGEQSNPIAVKKGHYPPKRPARLRATRVTESAVRLSWTAGKPGSGQIGGYRIFRDGIPVKQVKGLSGSDTKLAAATRYRYTVAAVDTWGFQSTPTPIVSLRTARPPQTFGEAHAFLLASTDESFRDLQRHYRQIGTVYPTYFQCRESDGALRGTDDPLMTRWAQVRGIRVLPRFNCQVPGTVHMLLTDPARRTKAISDIATLVRDNRYDGINIDFENGAAEDSGALTAFVSQLAGRLHAAGKQLSVEVSAKYEATTTGRSGFYDYEALARSADHVFVMNWGWHWETSLPGAPDDLEMCTRVADYVASLSNRNRFVLGTHLYGMDWPAGGGPANHATALENADVRALIQRYGTVPALDPVSDSWNFIYFDDAGVVHEVWYPTAATIARRIALATDRGLAIGFWRLGREDPAIWKNPQLAI
jgi:spore germination protein YaaH